MNEKTKCGCCETNEALLLKVRQLAESYRGTPGSLIQVLHLVQGVYEYLPLEVQKIVAEALDIPLATVSGVVSFYSFFSTEPRGKHTIRVCLGTACYVRGGVSIVNELEKKLDVKLGHVTKDGVFAFEVARCIGACGLAPAMSIDDTVYKQVTPDKLDEILAPYYAEGGIN